MNSLQPLNASLLVSMPLPQPEEGSKEERGRVTVIGGSREVPGAVILAGLGALRAGAGKLQVATVASRAVALAVALPEALIMELPETPAGGLCRTSMELLFERVRSAHSILIGPGMVEDDDGHSLLTGLLGSDIEGRFVVDAGALPRLLECAPMLRRRSSETVVTPHAGEMANLLGIDRAEVEQDPLGAAKRLVQETGSVVVMKGEQTYVAALHGVWKYSGGSSGLATSGSGDVLAGIVAGLLARGASAAQAALWGVFLHGEAGMLLSKSIGPLGFLAREILVQIPSLMASYSRRPAV